MNKLEKIVVVKTGVANTASVISALSKIGAESELSACPRQVQDAQFVVLPGVGAFASGMFRLREASLVKPLAERVQEKRPTLAICLGLQMLASGSDENSDIAGIGVFEGKAKKFSLGTPCPQLGWNYIKQGRDCNLLESGYAYFANSYRLESTPAGWSAATAEHGGEFIAGLERGSVLGCQFHPELSGAWGLSLIKRWLLCSKKQKEESC